ncbi:putative zinc metalloprotease [Nymphaea thermarum]|nr:putative zinc metalloprotease [Nymphaea thermarum]
MKLLVSASLHSAASYGCRLSSIPSPPAVPCFGSFRGKPHRVMVRAPGLLKKVANARLFGGRSLIPRATPPETEMRPESNDDENEKESFPVGGSPASLEPIQQADATDFQSSTNPNNSQSQEKAMLDISNTSDKDAGDSNAPVGTQGNDEVEELASGSPLPGVKQLGEPIRIPKASIDILRDQVFGFDTFFVTSQEPYEGGVLFKGNLRGQASTSYEKLTKKMQDKFGDQFKLFLLTNPEDDKPIAVVVPRQTLQPEANAVPEWFAASAFGLVTIFTLLLRNVPALQSNLLSTFDNLELLKDGLPGALVTIGLLGVHEVSHILTAKSMGAKLGVPYFVPSWQIGSFGAITRILSIIRNRQDLLKLAAAGPLAGFSLGLIFLLLGFILPPADGLGIVVDPSVFHESLLVGGLAKLLLGDVVKEGTPLSINPLVLWAWSGLLINAINSIPAGELDGGRISFALWGRKAWARITGASIALLGVSSLFNDVAFYWVALIFFLQRGPISPLSEEITHPDNKSVALGISILFLGLLICLPYPFPFAPQDIL